MVRVFLPTLNLGLIRLVADAILCGPGCPHEMETCLVDGRLQRVYKNLSPSLRTFWLSAVDKHFNDTYIVFEEERLTYGQVHRLATRLAGIFYTAYSVRKGITPVIFILTSSFSLYHLRGSNWHMFSQLCRVAGQLLGLPCVSQNHDASRWLIWVSCRPAWCRTRAGERVRDSMSRSLVCAL